MTRSFSAPQPTKHNIAQHIVTTAVLRCFSLTAFAEDVRHQPLKNLNSYFPFHPPESLERWERRKESVRWEILVATGLRRTCHLMLVVLRIALEAGSR
ncbi:hypothetical protein Pla52o_01560 [Novipirellula galeiformis]|uniref:Uncharacterized protein n=1 Tax=Novipirellula galeiformis TaxID=2528004 RepID=A0A5C6CMZ1_9BACT|nr:hypothetical protein [Novipirellula galeiformis]TWU26303.1 hypothetical protein Pla52o_01560 [Novipirellula galeiformis]